MKRSSLSIAVAFALAGCASASGGAGGQGPNMTPSNTTISGTGSNNSTYSATASHTVGTYSDNGPVTIRVQFAPDQVFPVLAPSYVDAGLPAPVADPASHTVATARFEVSRQLGGQRLSNYFSCGETPMGMPVADAYRVSLAVRSSARPQENGSRIDTQVTATAFHPGTGATVNCTTTGVLERRVNDAALRRLGATGR